MADTAADWTPDFGTLDAAAPAWAAKRPIRIALLGDFGAGACRGRLDDRAALAQRTPIPVEFDTLEDALARLDVHVRLPLGAGGAPVELTFGELDAFHPDTLFRELDLFRHLADLRKRLANTATFAKAAAEVQKLAGGPKPPASRIHRKARSRAGTPATDLRLDDFARLTGRPSAAAKAQAGIDALLRDLVAPFVVPAPKPEAAALVATLDRAIADAMCALLHHPEFQNTESLWRGADFLLRRLETGPMLQVHLFDISAEEFAADLGATQELSETASYRLLVQMPAEQRDGGYAAIAGLYRFEATPVHAELLGRMAKIAQAAGAPFLTGIAIDALANPRQAPHPLVRSAFAALRALPEAGRLALLGPRFLLRHPYGKRSDPIGSFGFEEFTRADGLAGMLWGHPVLLALTAAFGQRGATTVGDLPFHHLVDADGDRTALPCTERFVSSDMAAHLHRQGVTALLAHRGEPSVKLAGLDAINGEAIFVATTNAPATRGGDRIQIGSRPGERAAPASARARPANADAGEKAPDESATDDADASSTANGSDDLDALLASLGESGADGETGQSSDASSGSDADATDPDLEALLNSLK